MPEPDQHCRLIALVAGSYLARAKFMLRTSIDLNLPPFPAEIQLSA